MTDGLSVKAIPNDGPVSSESMSIYNGVAYRTEEVGGLSHDWLITIDGTDGTFTDTEIVKWTYDLNKLMPGVHRSRYVFDNATNTYLNSYKNTIRIFDCDGSFTVMRKYTQYKDYTTTVATVTLNTDGTYTVTYPDDSWSTNTEQENRYDKEAANSSGNIAAGIVVDDYFKNVNESFGSYTYYVAEDTESAGTFVVNTCYLTSVSASLANTEDTDNSDGYTKAQITNDTDRNLSTAVGLKLSILRINANGYTDEDIKKVDVYRNGSFLETVDYKYEENGSVKSFTYNTVTDQID